MGMRFIYVAAVVCLGVGCAGCPGVRRHSPGPVAIERRTVVDERETRRRGVEFCNDTEPLTHRFIEHPSVGKIRGRGSLSIGTPVNGFVYAAAELPLQGPSHRVMREQRNRGTNFGTDELVAALQKAGADVARRHKGSVLPLGNIARGGGGELKWSVSHKSGRDADIGYYLKDQKGRQIFQESMTSVRADGTTVLMDGTTARFDPARNWLLVKSLLTNGKISVQWMFMADHLKKRIIDHARSKGEPVSVIELAQQAIAQPRGKSHDDHIHLRLYCSSDDLLEGCVDIGSNRPWYKPPGPAVERRLAELFRLSRSKDAGIRRDAILVLGHFGNRKAVHVVARALSDQDGGVRRAAADAMGRLGIQGVEAKVAAAVSDLATPDDVAARLLSLLSAGAPGRRPANGRAKALTSLVDSERLLVVDNGVFVMETRVSSVAAAAVGIASRPVDGAVGTAN